MNFKIVLGSLAMTAGMFGMLLPVGAQGAEPHGWLGTETLKTRFGDFEFKDGYPVGDTAERLLELQKLNRAVEVYLTQMMPVSEIALREGLRAFGAKKPTQVVIWENLMDARTVLLTANTETVYALSHLDLKSDGPTVVEAPPHMLGFLQDGLQRYLADVGPLGPDKGKGGKFLVLPPGYSGSAPEGYFVVRSPNLFGDVRDARLSIGRQDRSSGRLDEADQGLSARQGLVAASDGVHERLAAGHRHRCSPTTSASSSCLAMLVEEEPRSSFSPFERFQMQAIGIEKGKPFNPDDKTKALLAEAARIGGAMARANTYASPRRRMSSTIRIASGRAFLTE